MTTTSDASLRGKVLDSLAAVQAMRDELAHLAQAPDTTSSIVQHPDWLIFELVSRSGNASPYVVVVHDETGQVVGYAPFLVARAPVRVALGKLSIPLYQGRIFRLLGAQVVAAAARWAAVDRVVSETLAREPTARVIYFQEAELPNSLAEQLTRGSGQFTCRQTNFLDQLNWFIRPHESVANYLDSLSSKSRSNLARRVRNVYKKLGETVHLRVVETADAIDNYCALMNHVYARSWHAKVLPIDWKQPARQALFEQLAANGQLIGHLLMLGERPIAYVHGYRLGGRYLLDDTGYDEEFAELSVGLALVFQTVQDLIERNPGLLIDFGYGDNQYKRVLASESHACGSLYAVRGVGVRARFLLITPLRLIYHTLRWARDTFKQRHA